MPLYFDIYQSPLGEIAIVTQNDTLVLLDFNDNQARIDKLLQRRFGQYQKQRAENSVDIAKRLDDYFNGDPLAFQGLNYLTEGSEFQQAVWENLRKIPWGSTISYAQLASNIGKPKAVRAVANANANNPLAIITPCHRVIGKNGTMRGYAGGEDRKVWLLKHEGVI